MHEIIRVTKEEFERLLQTDSESRGIPVYFCDFGDGVYKVWPKPEDQRFVRLFSEVIS